MLFSESIPEKVLESPQVSSFIKVLDSLQNYKSDIIGKSLRVNNPAVLTDRKWLLKKLDEIGVSDFPEDMPIETMQLYLLNADTIFRTRGSKIGVELYCNVLTLGRVTVVDKDFYSEDTMLIPDSLTHGYVVSDNSKAMYYLVGDNSELTPSVKLGIGIQGGIVNATIKKYLEKSLPRQIGFGNVKISIIYAGEQSRFYHKLLNSYFV